MKPKISIDQEAIKGFFVDHTEKIVFAGIVICFALIVYKAVARETFEKQPQDLLSAADRAKQRWQQGTLPPEAVRTRDYAQIAKTNSQQISLQPYRWEKLLNAPPAPKKPLRGIPPVLNVRGLRAQAGRASFSVSGVAAGAGGRQQRTTDRHGFRYVVLTGLIPVKEQLFAYEDYYRERVQYSLERDVPTYYWYAVERAEIGPEENPDEVKFAPFDTRLSLAVRQQWGKGEQEELADKRFVHERLTFPLPPRTGDTWGEEVVYPDEIPLPAGETDPTAMGEDAPGELGGPVAPDLGGIPELPDLPGERDTARTPTRLPEEVEEEPDNLLFRFFDFSVEAGKRYRYRVKLWLVNSSYGMAPRFLETMPDGEPPLATRKYIESTKWSDATEAVEIPPDFEVMLLAVKAPPPSRVADNPLANLGVVQWVNEHGRMTFQDFEGLKRGSLVDFSGYLFPGGKVEEEEDKPATRPKPTRPKRPRRGGGEEGFLDTEAFEMENPVETRPRGPEVPSDAISVDYLTGAIVLDIRGGERLSDRGGERRPGEALLLDADGNLVIHRVLDEEPAFEEQREAIEAPPELDRPGRMPGMPMQEGSEGGLIWEGA